MTWSEKIPEDVQKIMDEAGYKSFHSVFDESTNYIRSYQKCVRDMNGKKYFINIHIHENTMKTVNPSEVVFNVECQFTNDMGTFDVNYHVGFEASMEKIENFFEDMWRRMSCSYYDNNY